MTETTPDPADVHTGTDRVELTKDEKRALNIPLVDTHSTNLYAAVESIVAARVQALTAERDFERSRCASLAKTADAYMAERDAARAELAAANTRYTELEQKVAYLQKRLEVTRETIHRQSEAQGFDGLLDQRDALQATLDRVTAETESVIDAIEETFLPQLPSKALSYFAQEDVNAGLDAMRERFGLEAGR